MNQYLKLLELDEAASLEDIKKAYRSFAKKWHPDISKDNGEKFKQLGTAYEWLCDNYGHYPKETVEIKREKTRQNYPRPDDRFTKYYRIIDTKSEAGKYVIRLPERWLQRDTLIYYMINGIEQSQLFTQGTALPVSMRVFSKAEGKYVTLVVRYAEPEM